jgi:hypothetical protein
VDARSILGVQSLRAALLDDVSASGSAESKARRRAARGGACVLTDEQIFLMARSFCLNNPDRVHHNGRLMSLAAPAGRQYVLQDDDDVDEDDDDDDDVDDDDDADTDEDEADDEEEEEETWQVSATTSFR